MCNGVEEISVDVSGLIRSPRHPEFYGNGLNCTLSIMTEGDLTFVNVNLLMMNLEKSYKGSPVDYLIINICLNFISDDDPLQELLGPNQRFTT